MGTTQTARGKQKTTSSANSVRRGTARQVEFKIKALPDCMVCVAGTFNRWDPAATRMEPDGTGYYLARLALPPGRHEYKFLVNGVWQLDPACPHCVPNALGSQNHVIELF